jgi:hypothetical protein
VTVRGRRTREWSYDATTRTASVRTGPVATRRRAEVVLRWTTPGKRGAGRRG